MCLPTGLGKTLIAAVVMHNFTRWFPEASLIYCITLYHTVSHCAQLAKGIGGQHAGAGQAPRAGSLWGAKQPDRAKALPQARPPPPQTHTHKLALLSQGKVVFVAPTRPLVAQQARGD